MERVMKTNAGFEIIIEETGHLASDLSRIGVALGKRLTSLGPEWVTWEFTENADGERSYYWGHYLREEPNAYVDYHKRVLRVLYGV